MRLFGDCVGFRSTPEHFAAESDGRKSNTVRWMTPQEYDHFQTACPTYIEISETRSEPVSFTRPITDVCVIGSILGNYLVVISWRHE